MSKIVIDVERGFHDLIKIEAIKHGQSMKDFIVNSMQRIIKQHTIKTEYSQTKLNNNIASEKDFTTELKGFMAENGSILKELADR